MSAPVSRPVDSTVDVPALATLAGFPLANSTGNGMIGGVQAGYNHQMGWAVVGIEGSLLRVGYQRRGAVFWRHR